MIDHKTPGAYTIDKGGRNRGYTKRFTWEQIDELRTQGESWADIAAIFDIPRPALYKGWWRWNQKRSRTGLRVGDR